MAKITRATFKSFVRKNMGDLVINVRSTFDGMTDGCAGCHDGFTFAVPSDHPCENNLGINGVWLVGGNDYYQAYNENGRRGIEVSNCCGHFIVAVEEAKTNEA